MGPLLHTLGFDAFKTFILGVLVFFYHAVGDFGLAIILLTIAMRIILIPLTWKQTKSMYELQRVQPKIKAIQEKYKKNKEKQQEELMKFYRENNINPASSCLPLLAQFPVFIALYLVLKHFPHLPGDNLMWLGLVNITDKASVGWGPLLIAVYAISQLASSYFMSATAERSQRIMLLILPIAFIPFIINFKVGLVLYWMTTNLWTVGQGLITRRLMPRPQPPERRSSRTPPKEVATAATPEPEPTPAPATPAQPRRVKRKKTKKARR